jgi:hypothetical protein
MASIRMCTFGDCSDVLGRSYLGHLESGCAWLTLRFSSCRTSPGKESRRHADLPGTMQDVTAWENGFKPKALNCAT